MKKPQFKFTKTSLDDVFVIEKSKFEDDRGTFIKTYNKEELSKFQGLLWFHYIAFLQIIESGKSYFISHPFVLNKGIYLSGPNEANAGGVSIEVLLNLLEYINNLNPLNYTEKVKNKVINDSFSMFYRKVASARMYGARINYTILPRLFSYYWRRPQLYFFILPIYFMPGFFYRVIYNLRKLYRKIVTNSF
jgi:hypothetical protein